MRGLVVACGLAALVFVSGSLAASGPSLALVHRSPLAVRGSGFQPRTAVRVVETSPAAHTVVVRASAAGTFVTGLVSGDPCAAILVRAVGRGGGLASLHVPPARLCAPARPSP
jgi:hypothetical protein